VEELKQPREIAKVLSTRRLLEMDAVLSTYFTLSHSRMTRRAEKNLQTIRNFWMFTQMDEVYLETIRFCLASFTRLVLEEQTFSLSYASYS
jgi:hypothetical protein